MWLYLKLNNKTNCQTIFYFRVKIEIIVLWWKYVWAQRFCYSFFAFIPQQRQVGKFQIHPILCASQVREIMETYFFIA